MAMIALSSQDNLVEAQPRKLFVSIRVHQRESAAISI
jgi:hypothetical protein